MNAHRRARGVVSLLIALDDGRVVVDARGQLPAIGLPPGEHLSGAVRHLEDCVSLAYGVAHLAVTDDTEAEDGTVVDHTVVWRGLLPGSWAVPTPYRAAPVGEVLAALSEGEAAARLRAACRAGLFGNTVRFRRGRRPGARPSKAERTRATFTWRSGTHVPKGLEVRQVWGWLTDQQGRVLVLLDHSGAPSLPGGRPEAGESPVQTLAREAAEEASACLGTPVVVGFQQVTEHGQAPYAQLRMAAPLLRLGPARPDPDSGETYRRVLVPVRQANLLLGWGPEGDAQVAAVAASCPASVSAVLEHVPEQGSASTGTERNGVRAPGPRPGH
ncbi:NUDIX domain-containing protein [Streptomyces sp. NPDC002537]